MRPYRYPPYQRQFNQQIPPFQQPVQAFQQTPNQNQNQYMQAQPPTNYMYQQPLSPFEQFAKPKQPQDWYVANQESQADYPQPGYGPSAGIMSQFQDQNGQFNLDKVLSTVSQFANTYHQVSPIIKQFGAFMKTFR